MLPVARLASRILTPTVTRNNAYYNAASHPRDSHGRWASTDHLQTATELHWMDKWQTEVVNPQGREITRQHGSASPEFARFLASLQWGPHHGPEALQAHEEALKAHLQDLASHATPTEVHALREAMTLLERSARASTDPEVQRAAYDEYHLIQRYERMASDAVRAHDAAPARTVEEAQQRIFGRGIPAAEWGQIFGVPADAVQLTNDSSPHNPRISLNIQSPAFQSAIHLQKSAGTGAVTATVDWVHNTGDRSSASGREILRVMQSLQHLGIQQVYATAGHGITHDGVVMNGYYTWARMGFTGRIPLSVRHAVETTFGPQITTVEQLMAQPGGPKWWKEHGTSFEAMFDFTPGSHSMQVFERLTKHLNEQRMRSPLSHALRIADQILQRSALEWDENLHPRGAGGKFIGGSGLAAERKAYHLERMVAFHEGQARKLATYDPKAAREYLAHRQHGLELVREQIANLHSHAALQAKDATTQDKREMSTLYRIYRDIVTRTAGVPNWQRETNQHLPATTGRRDRTEERLRREMAVLERYTARIPGMRLSGHGGVLPAAERAALEEQIATGLASEGDRGIAPMRLQTATFLAHLISAPHRIDA